MLLQDKVAIITVRPRGSDMKSLGFSLAHGARLLVLDRNAEQNASSAKEHRCVRGACGPDGGWGPPGHRPRRRGRHRSLGAHRCARQQRRIYPCQEFLGMTEAQWDEMQDVNLKSMFHLHLAVLPAMIQQGDGAIINISSVTFHKGIANLAHYVAAKGGVVGLTCALRARNGHAHHVRVNCITPGAVLVEAEKAVMTDEQITAWIAQ